MAELIDVMQGIIGNYCSGSGMTDIAFGTVSKVDPLQVTLVDTMLPIPTAALHLTESVVEKKIPLLKHGHTISEGSCQPALENIMCYENENPLPVKDGYIILNRGLETGDKVLMLRVKNGQAYIVLSRVF